MRSIPQAIQSDGGALRLLNVISVKNLVKTFPGTIPFTAVKGISFDLREREILGLLGPNGSGKTTTIQMLLGTLTATTGSISYFGQDFFKNRSEILQHVSYASTYTSLPWSFTIKENLEIFGALYGMDRKESSRNFCPLLERFGIIDKLNVNVGSLSEGQVTRLVLVKAFFIKPKVVLLDEPTASLDPDVARDICCFIQEQRNQNGTSILFTSHKMDEVMEICDRTIFLKAGQIIADDIPKNLAKKFSSHRVVIVIVDGLKRLIGFVESEKYPYSIEHRIITIQIDEEKIPHLLNTLRDLEILYSNVRIEEPSLEDYFLHIARD